MKEKDILGRVPNSYYHRKEAAQILGIDEEAVRRLGNQGRPDVYIKDGQERYELSSVYQFKAEELIRAMQEKARKECPELCPQIDEMATLQFQRGKMLGGDRIESVAIRSFIEFQEDAMKQAQERQNKKPDAEAS